jgi:hypothetical protein
MLARVWLIIRGTIGGAVGAVHIMGNSAFIRRTRLISNAGIDLFNMSGPGYEFLLRQFLDFPGDPLPSSTARNAVTATALNLDMVLPVAVNLRDPLGLIMLQSEQTLITLEVQAETFTTVTAGGVVTVDGATPGIGVQPYIEWFTVPKRQEDYPPLNVVHQIIEETAAVPAAGQFTYSWPRGNTYLQMIHGLGFQVTTPADGWSAAQLRINQSDNIADVTPNSVRGMWGILRYQAPRLGILPWDLISTTGLGVYDSMRDTIDSSTLTDLATVLTATGAGTLYSMRRQLIGLS